MRLLPSQYFLLAALFAAVLASAIALPLLAQQKRQRLNALYALTQEHDKAQAEWNRLLLEQATLSTPKRIEQLAAAQLQLHIPTSGQLQELAP